MSEQITDRELDILVAEKVLGMRIERIQTKWYNHDILCFYEPSCDLMVYSYDENACNAMMYRNGVDERDGVAQPLPHYSLEMETAWEVVEAISKPDAGEDHGWQVVLSYQHGRRPWVRLVKDRSGFGHNPEAQADTMPRAICLVALLAASLRDTAQGRERQ